MKKLNVLLLAAFAFAFTACDTEKGNSEDKNVNDLIGTWYFGQNLDMWPEILESMDIYANGTISFTSDGKVKEESEWYKSEGKYTYEKGLLTTWTLRAWQKDYETEKWEELADSMFDILPTTLSPKFLYNGNIMIQKYALEDDFKKEGWEDGVEMFFKQGATEPSDSKLIQGFWIWPLFGNEGTIRCGLKIDGNKFTWYNCAWHERMTGTCEYKNGVIKFNVDPKSYQERHWYEWPEEDDFDEMLISNLEERWETPGGYKDITTGEWVENTPTWDYEFVLPFIVEGNEAYCNVANLAATFVKQ